MAARCTRAAITAEPIDLRALEAEVDDPRCGAVVSFSGVVRNHDAGRGVDALDYSSHPSAEAELRAVVDRFRDAPGVHAIAVSHRVGALRIGDLALAAAVAGEHRAEAFRTLESLIEEVKRHVPIWKRQTFDDGSAAWTGL